MREDGPSHEVNGFGAVAVALTKVWGCGVLFWG